jgi:hypothetical protein
MVRAFGSLSAMLFGSGGVSFDALAAKPPRKR